MGRGLHCYVILVCITRALAKDPEPELPPCPTNYQFLPNSLPMHCKMVNPPVPYPIAPPGPFPPQFPPYFAGPIPGKPAGNNPGPAKPVAPPPAPGGMPAMPMGAPMPMGMPGMPMGLPGMPMGMPGMPMGGPPQQKMPVIVMPFYSPDPSYKNPKGQPAPNRRPKPYKRRIRVIKKRHRSYDTDSTTDTDSSDTDDTSSSSESDRGFWNWKNRRAMSRRKKMRHMRNKKEFLTPILQYVSKDGYVIFEKQISKGEAKDWLGDVKGPNEVAPKEENKPSQTDTKHDNIDNKPEEHEEDEPEPVERKKSSQSNDLMKKLLVKFTKNAHSKSKKQSQPTEESAKKKRQY